MRSVKRFNPFWSLALAGALGLGAAPASAQQLLAWPQGARPQLGWLLPGNPVRPLPHPTPLPRPFPLPTPAPTPTPATPPEASPLDLSGYDVTGRIQDQTAELTYQVAFTNPTDRRLEGVLIMPIPADTVLSDFAMTVAGKETKGELLEAAQAATIYENIVRSQRDPGLLELMGERMVRARVFPIEPRSTIIARLTVTQVVGRSGDLNALTVPMASAKMLSAARSRGRVRLTLETTRPIRTLYSPSGASLRRDGERRAEISYDESAGTGGDLSLFYSLRQDPLAAGFAAFREEGEDGTFLLSLSPKPEAAEGDVLPKDIVFIVDRSGSMEEGGKMEQARKALVHCLSRLSAQDRFGIVDFATDSNSFAAELTPATPENRARAVRYAQRIEAAGGTNIEAGLRDGLALLSRSEGRVPMVFFLTDGLPTVGQTDMQALLRQAGDANNALRARVFSFGVGLDVNTLFLDKLADMNRGTRDYVQPGEDIENKVSSLYQKLAKPALTDVKLEWEGIEVSDVFPRPITDLFHGSELVLMGRYPKGGKGRLIVTGRSGKTNARFEFPVELPERESRNSFLPRLWAHRKVAHELDAIRLAGGRADPEVVKDVVRLAKRYGIVTPYTSFLITEEGRDMRTAQQAAGNAFDGMRNDAAASGFGGAGARSLSAQKASSFLHRMAEPALMSIRGGSLTGAAAPAPAAAMAEAENEVRAKLKDEGLAAAQTRSVAGKTFYRRGGAWVDGDFELASDEDRAKAVEISAMSPEYFELLRKHPGLGRYLALGGELTVVFDGTAYRVTP